MFSKVSIIFLYETTNVKTMPHIPSKANIQCCCKTTIFVWYRLTLWEWV